MKRRKLLLVALCLMSVIVCSIGLVSCIDVKEHEHTYETEWSWNAQGHYHKCTNANCDSIADVEVHAFGEWEVDTPATVDEKGSDKRECTVC